MRVRHWAAAGDRTGGSPRPHQHPDRRSAVHQHPHDQLAPGPDPGQDWLPLPRRPEAAGPGHGSGL